MKVEELRLYGTVSRVPVAVSQSVTPLYVDVCISVCGVKGNDVGLMDGLVRQSKMCRLNG